MLRFFHRHTMVKKAAKIIIEPTAVRKFNGFQKKLIMIEMNFFV